MLDDEFKRLLLDLPPAPHCPTCGDATYSVYTRQLCYPSFEGIQVIPLRVCTFCARDLKFHDAALQHTKAMLAQPRHTWVDDAMKAHDRSLRD